LSATWEFLKTLTNPESILSYGGLWLLLFVIFAETGLLVGFFLPGDNLVFLSGLLCATKPVCLGNTHISLVLTYMIIAAVFGNISGYYFGRKTGDRLFTRDDNVIFKKRYLLLTRDFYSRHGGKTLVLGRFLPVIRTFAPILAGVIKIDFKRFMIYNVAGATVWIGGIGGIGYFLGRTWPGIYDYIGYIIILMIVFTAIPVIRTYVLEKKRVRQQKE
jgi:membrane-associated protein